MWGVLWCSRLRIWCCYYCGSGRCCGMSSIPGPGNFCMLWAQPKTNTKPLCSRWLRPWDEHMVTAVGAGRSRPFPPRQGAWLLLVYSCRGSMWGPLTLAPGRSGKWAATCKEALGCPQLAPCKTTPAGLPSDRREIHFSFSVECFQPSNGSLLFILIRLHLH